MMISNTPTSSASATMAVVGSKSGPCWRSITANRLVTSMHTALFRQVTSWRELPSAAPRKPATMAVHAP